MPIALNDYFQDGNVDGYREYIANIITGYAQINHQYLDRSLNRFRVENGRGLDPNRNFIMLEDAFDGYYWPIPDGGFELNNDVLEGVEGRLRDARMHGNEVEIYNAMNSE